ncbi:hypothetical protein AAE026_37660 [Bradyrhizobium sp. DN5]|uniref:hypothetical protein n=1 Tax=Bradyrhizobium sp. DN5 TaxID=3056950 RepID=UPI003524AE1C
MSEPDLFERPTRSDEVARHVERKIRAAGLLYWRVARFLSVAETRELLDDLQIKLGVVYRRMEQLPNVRRAFNAVRDRDVPDSGWYGDSPDNPWYPYVFNTSIDEEEVPEHEKWGRLLLAIDDGWSRVGHLLQPDVNLGELLEQPPTNQKNPGRVLWEAIFALLRECGVEPLEKYQPLIHTLRAVHLLFGIEEPPNAGHLGYVKSEFLKQASTGVNSKALGEEGK